MELWVDRTHYEARASLSWLPYWVVACSGSTGTDYSYQCSYSICSRSCGRACGLHTTVARDQLPPDQQTPAGQSRGNIHGTVTDSAGNVIAGARVALGPAASKSQPTLLTDGNGFFNFIGLESGTYRIAITSQGFAAWASSDIVLPSGGSCELAKVALRIAPVNTDVNVVLSRHDLAEEQLKVQEKQRVLGVFPNFYVSYVWNAVPLTPKQKFRLALRNSIDPTTIVLSAGAAGIEQWQNYFSGYGQGSKGYFKRFGASYADGVIGTMIGGAILPSILTSGPALLLQGHREHPLKGAICHFNCCYLQRR